MELNTYIFHLEIFLISDILGNLFFKKETKVWLIMKVDPWTPYLVVEIIDAS